MEIDNDIILLPRHLLLPETQSELDQTNLTLTKSQAQILNNLWLDKFNSMITKLLGSHPNLSETKLRFKVNQIISNIDIKSFFPPDPIYLEALSLARETIESRLASENLPVPANLNSHCETLVEVMPELLFKAKERVRIRRTLMQESLIKLGVEI